MPGGIPSIEFGRRSRDVSRPDYGQNTVRETAASSELNSEEKVKRNEGFLFNPLSQRNRRTLTLGITALSLLAIASCTNNPNEAINNRLLRQEVPITSPLAEDDVPTEEVQEYTSIDESIDLVFDIEEEEAEADLDTFFVENVLEEEEEEFEYLGEEMTTPEGVTEYSEEVPTNYSKDELRENPNAELRNDSIEFLPPTFTPPSLMLHSANLQHLDDLIPLLGEYNSLTYEGYYEKLRNGETIENPLLISIDDLGTYWLRRDFKEMIQKFSDAGIVGTLGIVTTGSREEAKEDIWTYLNEVKAAGWELAIHTEDHWFLPGLNEKDLRYQIEETYLEILLHTGEAPTTIILPFGGLNNPDTGKPDQRIVDICRDLGIVWIVSIQGGREFEGDGPYIVGRVPPSLEAQEKTVGYFERLFGVPYFERFPGED